MNRQEYWTEHARRQKQRCNNAFIWGLIAGGFITLSVFRIIDMLVLR